MTGFGVLLIILGLGSLLLPLFDLQFRLMEFVDPYQPWAGFIVAAIGAILVGLGLQRRATVTTTTTTAAPTAAAPAAASASDAAAAAPATPPSGEPPADTN
jgi:hypothetical protein